MSDNATVVAYLRNRVLWGMALDIVLWTERHFVLLSALYIPGKKNVLVDQLSCRDQVLPAEWSLLPRVFEAICGVFRRPHLDLFATQANAKLPLYISLVPDPMAWKQEAFQHPWDHLSTSFPPFALLRQVLSRVRLSAGLSLVLVAPLWPQKEWFTDLLSLLISEPLKLLQVWNLLVQPHVQKFHRGLGTLHPHTWKLSSVSFERQASLEWLWRSQLLTSGDPQWPSTSRSGLVSSIGVIDGVSIPARWLSLK